MKYIRLKTLLLKRDVFITGMLFILLASYYLLFINRGLVLGDEGYSAHNAERILQGQVPYRDFFLQYPPGYFYVLAALYKLFGASIIVGRLLSLAFCLGIFLAALALLRAFSIASRWAKSIVLLSLAAFGYPLINIPVVVWPTVLITELVMICLLKWLLANRTKYLLTTGFLLGMLFLIKQNIAVVDALLINALLVVMCWGNLKQKVLPIIGMNTVWIGMTSIWLALFYLGNLPALFEFIAFNQRYQSLYPFTYPPLSFLLKPSGFFKLLPYYLPLLFLLLLFTAIIRKNADKKPLVFFLPVAGFITTIYPTSDLLHLYPYFGLILVSFLIFISRHLLRFQKVFYILMVFSIISGFYLTLFREYYRYQAPYRAQNTPLNLPKTKGILVDRDSARSIHAVYDFITQHTGEHDYIFTYSFSPMFYFLLNRQNPSRYSIYYAGYLTPSQENATIRDIQEKTVKYLISDDFDHAATPLSRWIKKQKKLQAYPPFTIYATQH